MEKRINILGPSASGKTTLATELSHSLSVPRCSIDNLRFVTTGNEEKARVPEEKVLRAVNDIIQGDSWILEGKFISEEIFERSNSAT